jgi:hypothetical protein
MALGLARDVHAVVIGDDMVFLDVNGDRYLCLVAVAGRILLRDDGGLEGAADALETLVSAGLASSEAAARPRTRLAMPASDQPWEARGPKGHEIAAAVWASLSTAGAFRRQTFSQLLETARRGRRSDTPAPRTPVGEAVAVFWRLRPWLPIGGACFKRSFLLLTYLHRLGLDADWVIGVRTWPFQAHCWLQADGVALDDDVERLLAYTPILRV